ncbi:nitrosoguanidine resistance protein SNG1 [Aspergillus nomiae NRRL 13137]|uniref:Nitrosoguanidine resistance protein SNG1 n=1 Tax=Aspergillus nomiae NRRL (strain ATCC 15546 / NRRL 13137 / CBS 260.88 / M93) TaxID=1509407 RepID=A0A0L1JGQ2_ASPN3|nr:nitrosoguanidine resistance protein SNG1 [Aspergillus nomiae NRRL 13137]KNG90902.1 nitrosoguanidine resistance protein SNG1 [Aspergillus nomiae NRRL 13137]
MAAPSPSPAGGSFKDMRKNFLIALGISFALLQLLFLCNMCYLYGTQYRDSTRFHSMKMLYVDYDGDVVGQSVVDAYGILRSDEFPSLVQSPASEYPTPKDVKTAVCKGDYWGAVYAHPGASANLSAALATGNGNRTSLTYIWNGARYPAFSQSAIYASIMSLVQVTKSAYYARNASSVLATAPLSKNPGSLQAFLNPIQATEINIKVTNQGGRVLYNTVSMVMPIIQQFFFMMALNGISAQFHLYTKLGPKRNGLLRMCVSLAYTFIGSLCMAGYIWAYRESWDVNSNQFVLSWMSIWLYMHINFLIYDQSLRTESRVYRWGYALPAHELYQVLVQIWSDGCEHQLHRALPIMFSWWIACVAIVPFAMWHRCKAALAAEQAATNVATDNKSTVSLPESIDRLHSHQSSTREIIRHSRRETAESIRLEHIAYGPSYPTPGVRGDEP